MKLMHNILISQTLLMMKMKVNSVLQSFILMKSFQSGLMKLRTACIDIVLLLKYISPRAFFCLKLVIDDSLCTLYKHVVMFLGEGGFVKNVT